MMKSFKKFLKEANTGGKPGNNELSVIGIESYTDADSSSTSVISGSIATASKVSSGLNKSNPSLNGFALEQNVAGILSTLTIGLNPEDFNSATALINTAQSPLYHRNNTKQQTYAFIMPMFQNLQQQGGMSPEEAKQIADALVIGGFKLDQVYDQMIKVYMEQLKSLGMQASPGKAATLLGAQSYYDRATRELGVPQRYVDLQTKPVPGDTDIKNMGLYSPAQQGMPGM